MTKSPEEELEDLRARLAIKQRDLVRDENSNTAWQSLRPGGLLSFLHHSMGDQPYATLGLAALLGFAAGAICRRLEHG